MTEFERVRRRLAEICLNCNHMHCTGKCARYTLLAKAVLRGEDVPMDGPVLTQQAWDVGKASNAPAALQSIAAAGSAPKEIANFLAAGRGSFGDATAIARLGRPPKLIVFRDRQYTLDELAALCTCNKRTVQRRIHDGWSIEEIYQLYSRRTRSNAGG